MKCLAVNTATRVMSVALLDEGKTLHYFETAEMRDQGNMLLAHVREGLKTAGLTFDDLDLLAVVTGPGSFTGIRIGLAAMRALALAAGKPVIGVSSFDMFAHTVAGHMNVVAVESWREELYFTAYDDAGHVVMPPMNVTPDEFCKHIPADARVIISGDAGDAVAALLPSAQLSSHVGTAVDAGLRAIETFKRGGGAHDKPVPFYLRAADVTISSKPARKLQD